MAGAAIFNKVWPTPPLINASAMSFAYADNTLKKMSATTLPEMTLKMGELQAAEDQAAKSMHDGGQTGQFAAQAYLQLGQQIDQLNEQQSQLTANQQILSSSFGITKNQAMEVAQALGVNLNQALDPSQVKAFGQYVTEMGLALLTTGTQIPSMSGTVITSLSSLESQTKTIFDPAAFAALGANIDQGIAQGIDGSQSLVAVAATGASEAALTVAKHNASIASPSQARWTTRSGIPSGQGIAEGLQRSASLITAASASATGGASRSLARCLLGSPAWPAEE